MKFDNILPGANRKESFFIPKEMTIAGSFKADTSGQIAGTINGELIVESKLVILKEAVVNGDISADELIVFGKINGDVRKCNKMTVRSGAIIMGNVNTIEIHIEKDTIIEGLITKSGTNTIINKKPELQVNKTKTNGESPVSPIRELDVPGERHAWF